MKHISFLVAVVALAVVVGAERAEAQAAAAAVDANIKTSCTMDALNAAVAPGAWVLTVPGSPNTRVGSTVNINNCNTDWSVNAVDVAATGNMVATAGAVSAGGSPVVGPLTDPISVNGGAVAVPAPVDNGPPTVSFDIPVTYAQPAQFADVAINEATGRYEITLTYTLTFTP